MSKDPKCVMNQEIFQFLLPLYEKWILIWKCISDLLTVLRSLGSFLCSTFVFTAAAAELQVFHRTFWCLAVLCTVFRIHGFLLEPRCHPIQQISAHMYFFFFKMQCKLTTHLCLEKSEENKDIMLKLLLFPV